MKTETSEQPTNKQNTVSVVILNYNYGHYIKDAIESIIDQDFPHASMELVLINDGSTDSSQKIIDKYVNSFKFIKAFHFKENKGIHYRVNQSVDLARGEYIHWLSADDFRAPHFLKHSMQALLDHPSIPLCCSDFGYTFERFDKKNFLSTPLLEGYSKPTQLSGNALCKAFRNSRFWIPGHTTIAKRETIIKFGKYDPSILEKCDWFLFNEIALNEGVIYLPETLAYLYSHDQSYSAKCMQSIDIQKRVVCNFLSLLDKNKRTRSLFAKAGLMGWACKITPRKFLHPKLWSALFYSVIKKISSRKVPNSHSSV